MKKIILYLFTSVLLFASENAQLYKKAQQLEETQNYKEAMLIYKQIAEHNLDKTIEVDNSDLFKRDAKDDLKADYEIAKTTIEDIKGEKEKKSIAAMLASSFDIYPYKENYFLPFSYDMKQKSNREQTEAKFQISIQKPLFENLFGFNESINIGYTQTSWWQLYKSSAPFRETNYQPEFFVIFPYSNTQNSIIKGFKAGFIHESNGQGGENSRSWNRIYLETYLEKGNLLIIPKVWHRIREDENSDNNPHTGKYYGYGDLTLVYPYENSVFKLLLRNNLRLNSDNKGFAQFDWSFPFFGLKNTFAYIQLSSGYGDSLIDYDKEINRASFGISLSR